MATTKPVHKIRMGRIQAAIWANAHSGRTFYSVTAERRYRSGESWKTSTSFGQQDLLALAKVIDEAHSWIIEASSPTHVRVVDLDEPDYAEAAEDPFGDPVLERGGR